MTTHRWTELDAGHCAHCGLAHETVWRDPRLSECQPDVVVGLRPRPRGESVSAYTHGGVIVEKFDGSRVTITDEPA